VLLVCPHCGTRYRITTQRVTTQGARARCVRCDRMFVIGGQRELAVMPEPGREAPARAGKSESRSGLGAGIGPDPFASLEESSPTSSVEPEHAPPPAPSTSSTPPAQSTTPRPAEASESIMQVIRGGGAPSEPPEVTMRVVRGGRAEDQSQSTDRGTAGAERVLEDEGARRLAEDLVAALAATYPEKIARARNDDQWEFHLGDVIRDARADFRAALAAGDSDRDELFNGALRHLLARGAAELRGSSPGPDEPGTPPPERETGS